MSCMYFLRQFGPRTTQLSHPTQSPIGASSKACSGQTREWAASSAGTSVSIVVLLLGTMSPTRYLTPLLLPTPAQSYRAGRATRARLRGGDAQKAERGERRRSNIPSGGCKLTTATADQFGG
jgi:hypothetical protein